MDHSYQSWSQAQTPYQPQPQREHEYSTNYSDDRQHQPGYADTSYQYPFQGGDYTSYGTAYPSVLPTSQNGTSSYSTTTEPHPSSTDTFQSDTYGVPLHGKSGYGQHSTSTPTMQQQSFHGSTTFHFQAPSSTSPNIGVSEAGSEVISRTRYLTGSPPPMHSQQASHYPSSRAPASSSKNRQKPKRQRVPDFADDDDDEDNPKERTKTTACARCKTLKVRCEFKTDTDPCKRCLNGGHDCYLPDRKKRRTPPKREDLLNRIREQADEIQRLMSQLEVANKASSRALPSATSDTFSSHSQSSPVLSPTTTHTSYFASDGALPASTSALDPEANKVVEDWIAKARESLAEFGGFIGMGGAGVPKTYIVEQDPEDDPSSEEDGELDGDVESVYNTAGEYEFAVVDSEGESAGEDATERRRRRNLRRQRSFASNHSTGSNPRKKESNASDKLASIPSEAVPFGLMAGLSLKKNKKRGSSAEVENEPQATLGVANDEYFRGSPAPDLVRTNQEEAVKFQAPLILTRGLISPQEAEALFKIFYDYMNLSLSLVDPVLYTTQRTFYRSPFLFTVICAIASRFYTPRPELYQQAMHYAQLAAGTALISGPKNIELCIGYILLSLYPVPAKRWEDSRVWMYLGLAIRIATDLNLHLPNTAKPQSENHAREQLNRTRVWLNCFNLDRSTGSQYGKTPIINSMDYTANHSENWWRSSPQNLNHFDIHICCYNAELRVMGRFLAKIYSDPNHPTGLNKEVDFEEVAVQADEELQQLAKKWFALLEQTDMTDPKNCFRTGLLRLAFSYARLIALSFGFQHAFGRSNTDENPFLMRCLAAATDVVTTIVHDVGRPSQRIYLRHGPEAQSVFVTFASAFLVKLLQPKFASYLTNEKRLEIRALVQSVVDLFSSPEVAIDDRHGPKLYAKFLKGLLNAPMVKSGSPKQTLPRHKPPRTKSSSLPPDTDVLPTVSPTVSPALTLNSLSPPPSTAAISFDQFAPAGGVIDPFAPVSASSSSSDTATIYNALDLENVTMADLFHPPLPFDDEIMQSMQSLTDPNVWQDIALPGFNWMSQFQSPSSQGSPEDLMYDHLSQG